ncbi:MAG TPA: DNA-processing protein DprA [Myxococcota bacterium]
MPTSSSSTAPLSIADLLALRRALETGAPIGCDDALAWIALDAAGLAGGFREAVKAAGGPRAVLEKRAVPAFSTPRQRTRVLSPEAIAVRLETLEPWIDQGLFVVADDTGLQRFADHPVCAFYGFGAAMPAPHRPVIGIVGSREAGPAYLERTHALAARLANAGAVIVSGGAGGIDTAAQQGARGVGGDVVVVTGRALQGRAMVPAEVRGDPGLCWLSPYAPWSPPGAAKNRFAQRNAYIAAMADVVIAVCGGERSGTRHTIEAALRFGRPVVSIAVDDDEPALAAICERLVTTGTGGVVADDVDLASLLAIDRGVIPGALVAWQHGASQPTLPLASSSSVVSLPPLGDDAAPIVRLLHTRGALTIDDAASALSTTVRELLVDVATLEMDGALRREGALLMLRPA